MAPLPFVHELGQNEDASEVDLESLVPGTQLGAEHGSEVGIRARVVDQDVDAGEPRHCRVDEPLQVLGLAGVRCDRHRSLGEPGVDALSLDVEVRLLPAGQNDVGALLDEGKGDGAADAAAGAGHQGDAAVETEAGALRHG
jgi:hypothetical protein